MHASMFILCAVKSMGFEKCIVSCILHYSITQKSLPNPNLLWFIYSSLLPPPNPDNTDICKISTVLPFPECHINWNHTVCSFFGLASFLSLSIIHLRFTYAFTFLLITKWYSIVWICHSLSISATERHLGGFQIGLATITINIHTGFCVNISFKPKSSWLRDFVVRLYLALKENCQAVFQSRYTILHSHQQWIPVASHSWQSLVLSVFWILAILIAVQ